MRALVCKSCGATGIQVKGGYLVCDYCDTRFLLTSEDFDFYGRNQQNAASSADCNIPGISLGGDIEMLLQKCRTDPKNAKKYANLILDIDPDNKKALRYL